LLVFLTYMHHEARFTESKAQGVLGLSVNVSPVSYSAVPEVSGACVRSSQVTCPVRLMLFCVL